MSVESYILSWTCDVFFIYKRICNGAAFEESSKKSNGIMVLNE